MASVLLRDGKGGADVYVTDLEEFDERKNVNGSMLYWPAREGEVVYGRDAA